MGTETERKVYRRATIDCAKLKPFVEELVGRCGSCEEAGRVCGVGKSTLYRILHDYHCTMQRATAAKIMVGLRDRRREDVRLDRRWNNPALKKAIELQARIESRRERLAGY